MITKIPLSEDEPLQPGDRIELTFKRLGIGIIDTTAGMLIEKKLRANPQYDLYDWDITDKQAIYRIRIKKPQGPEIQQASVATILAVVGMAGLSALAFGWMFLEARKIIESPVAMIGSAGFVIVGIIVLLSLWKQK